MDHDDIVRAARRTVVRALFVLALILAAQVMAAVVVVFLGLSIESMWTNVITEGCAAAAAVLGVSVLGGGDWVSISRDDIRDTFRLGWWCVAVSAALMVLGIVGYLADGRSIAPDALGNLLVLALFCLLVGICEEATFRGVILNALLAVRGGTHRGVVWSVVVTSVLFGAAHVDYSVAFNDALSVTQALLKTIQTGMYSLLLCAIVLRTRRLGGVSLFHGLDDFLILVPSAALFANTFDTSYISSGDDAMATIALYLVIIALYAPLVYIAVRELHTSQVVYRGVFMEDVVEAVEKAQAAQARQATPSLPGADGRVAAASVPAGAPGSSEPAVTRWSLDDMAGAGGSGPGADAAGARRADAMPPRDSHGAGRPPRPGDVAPYR